MARKLGLTVEEKYEASPEDTTLFKELFDCMELTGNDMTNTFRDLASVNAVSEEEFVAKIMSHAASKEIKLN